MSTTRGQHLIGKELGSCVLEKLLGYGGSSAVFLAQQQTPQRKVAVKVFLPRSTMDVQMQRNFYHRFLREAEAASELDYPTILPIYAYGEQDGWPYIIMPYMPGGTLAEYVERYGPLSVGEAQLYLEQLASALDYAHKQGCIHCDVKPANILLDGMGHAMLSDFGIARVTQPDSPINKHELKQTPETLMGTPDYISPEQALGQPLDGHSDIYSLGVTLFFLLTGCPPFRADSSIAMALLHVHEAPPALSTLRDDITPAIDRVVSKALAKWPEGRYQTAGEFSEAFARAIDSPESIEQGDFAYEDIRYTPAPLVHIKPVQQRSFNFSRTLIAIVLLLVITFGAAIAATLVISLTDSHTGPTSPLPTATVTKAVKDILADDKDAWPNNPDFFFLNGQYYILNNSPSPLDGALALYETSQYANFQLTVSMSEVRGSLDDADFYGVVFRSTSDESHYYLFEIAAGGGGQYDFSRFDGNGWKTLAQGSASLYSQLGESNIITIQAKGNSFTFSINGKPVSIDGKPAKDSSKPALTLGAVGLFVEEQNTEVAFSHMHIDP